MLTTTKQTPPARGGMFYPNFVMDAMEAVRDFCINDSQIRVHIDATAKSVISFNAQWLERRFGLGTIQRRVYIETALTEAGLVSVIFMAKAYDENRVVIKYKPNATQTLAHDIQQYLRLAKLPATVAVPA